MTNWIKRALTVAIVGCFATSCGPDCAAMCEDGQKCEDAEPIANCEKYCEDNEKSAEGAGCEAQYEKMLSCFDAQGSVCTAEDGCAKELAALNDCMNR